MMEEASANVQFKSDIVLNENIPLQHIYAFILLWTITAFVHLFMSIVNNRGPVAKG